MWDRLLARVEPEPVDDPLLAEHLDPHREALLRHLEVDLRVLSYENVLAMYEPELRAAADRRA